jgi:hypothetical protein
MSFCLDNTILARFQAVLPGACHQRSQSAKTTGHLICLTRAAVNNPNRSMKSERVAREGRCRKKGWFCETLFRGMWSQG